MPQRCSSPRVSLSAQPHGPAIPLVRQAATAPLHILPIFSFSF
ncbi:hypothetical protein KNP414_07640 [Paenibacillus mucilaginosus KNP414]|uniref:Uncharacterized protein n=1 Tax=Paenibacillus mucilaginosus (strain KNP414) TaxID=1036673 RepID=F8FCN6_PAEMK|nr:hypothetical protein KNP414_07640 [Paenibacillus mucilaginosus KNP414]